MSRDVMTAEFRSFSFPPSVRLQRASTAEVVEPLSPSICVCMCATAAAGICSRVDISPLLLDVVRVTRLLCACAVGGPYRNEYRYFRAARSRDRQKVTGSVVRWRDSGAFCTSRARVRPRLAYA